MAVRDNVRLLLGMSPMGPGDVSLQKAILKRFEEVFGCEHDDFLALWRHLMGDPHTSDFEYRVWVIPIDPSVPVRD